jgi:SAM-dependent methyltransferase
VSDSFFRALAGEAAARYPARDRYARHFARGKLRGDPVFVHLLRGGLLPGDARVLDLGCGQGLLFALLLAARESHVAGRWPADWPAPPVARALRGIDLMPRDIERARVASGAAAELVCGDIRSAEFGKAGVVVILDVLHYIDHEAQRDVLRRVRDTLGPGGTLLLRVADASSSLRFRITIAVDLAAMFLRGHRISRLHNRSVAQWKEVLASLGFHVEPVPMSAGTPFANVLLVARCA